MKVGSPEGHLRSRIDYKPGEAFYQPAQFDGQLKIRVPVDEQTSRDLRGLYVQFDALLSGILLTPEIEKTGIQGVYRSRNGFTPVGETVSPPESVLQKNIRIFREHLGKVPGKII